MASEDNRAIVFLTIANILYVICYGVRDVLWLRIMAVAAMVLIMPYYLFHHETPMFEPIVWNILFVVINAFWIVLIIRERRPPKLNDDEKKLYEMVFESRCTAKNMLRLLAKAEWKDVDDHEVLIEQGSNSGDLVLIHSGAASVQVKGRQLAELGAGDFVGEMSFLTGDPAVANVVSLGPVRYLKWDRRVMDQLFEDRLELKSAMHEVIGHDLVQKLTSSTAKVPSLTVDMRFD